MLRVKFFFIILIFSVLLIGTSFIKNQTRELEKKIYILSKKNFNKEKDLNETQLDFYYLTSPSNIEKKIRHLDNNYYLPMEYSQIYLNISNFMELKNKFATQESASEKKW